MINLSYKFEQDSALLEILGMPDVSNGDSESTIGILSSWTLKIIGVPLLEGEKDHLDNLMQVILEYSRSYISGFRKTFISSKNIVTISPLGIKHKLILNSTKKGVKPLEIILDDSELSDLTRCFDRVIYDNRLSISWNIISDRPYSKRYIANNLSKSKRKINLYYAFIIFVATSSLLLLIPTNNDYEFRETSKVSSNYTEQKYNI